MKPYISIILLMLILTLSACYSPMVFSRANGTPLDLEHDGFDCEMLLQNDPFAHAYAADPLANMNYPMRAREQMQRCMERKGWTRIYETR